uniref:Zinc finger, CCHC-type n=1 Tax=Tanacetum cinerariifolium TaxID=118510 RepID=A0A699HU81_TANCI|nr:zinc finger, CCHC-type [Tanacetum cinerariifolium]
MDPNQSDDERKKISEVDDETDMWFMMQAYEYDRRLQEKQNRPRITRNPINRDWEDAEIRLMGNYFDDYWNNVVPLRSDTIQLVQNGCSLHGLRSEDPNQHLKDFLKLVDSLDLDGKNKERTRLRLFQFSLRDQASDWLERLSAGSTTTWKDITTRFLAQFFPPGRTAKLRNDIMMFQQHHEESLSKEWTRFKDLLQKVPHHGIDLWLQV